MSEPTINSLSSSGKDYLSSVYGDFGGAKAAQIGKEAATRYLSTGEQSRVVFPRRLWLAMALSATALVITSHMHKDPTVKSPTTSSTKGPGCLVTVTDENGAEGAWSVATQVAPKGKFEEVYVYLANQQRNLGGKIHAGEELLAPEIACNNVPD